MPHVPKILLTRPRADSERFAQQLGSASDVVISPIFEVRHIGTDLARFEFSALVFSSQNAVRAIAHFNDLKGLNGFAVGARTAALARHFGVNAKSANGNADDLVALICAAKPKGKVMHLRGRHTIGDIEKRLKSCAIETESVVCYEQISQPLSDEAAELLKGNCPVILPLFSPRSAQLASSELKKLDPIAPISVVAMSKAVADRWSGPGDPKIVIAANPSADDMLKETLRLIQRSS